MILHFITIGTLPILKYLLTLIKQSLIDDIVTDKSARHMLRSIVEVFENLGYASVAEGVETEEQVQILKEAGCRIIQGYYYSNP